MRTQHRSPRRLARTAALAVAALFLMAGCAPGQSQPTGYGEVNDKGDGYYGNFMFGCTGVEPTDGKYSDVTLENPDFCRCVFDGLKEKVPFDEVKQFEETQAEAADGADIEIPSNIEAVRASCADKATGAS